MPFTTAHIARAMRRRSPRATTRYFASPARSRSGGGNIGTILVMSRIAVSDAQVPRVLMGQINYYLRDFFRPNVFVDITAVWPKKIEALQCYGKQWERAGKDWYSFLDEGTRYYGRMVGVERAEGLLSNKILL